MAGYQFGPNEKVVLRAQDVKIDTGSSFRSFTESELILTNENIIHPKKGMFGKIKEYKVWPLSSIRIVDGLPQCRLDSSTFMEYKLEISFQNEIVTFLFGGLEPKKEVRAWINEISLILTGNEAAEENLRATGVGAFTDSDNIAETFGDVFGSFENAFERKRAKAAPIVACRCPSCNASIKGKLGTTITCPYCESNVTIS